MIRVTDLIARARKAGVVFTVNGAQVSVKLPKPAGPKPKAIVDEIRQRGAEVKAAFTLGITVAQVLEIFPGANVIEPEIPFGISTDDWQAIQVEAARWSCDADGVWHGVPNEPGAKVRQ